MSKISKYLQLNDKLLLEYTYDTNALESDENARSNVRLSVLKDLTGRLMLFENPTSKNVADSFLNGFQYNAFPNQIGDEYFYTGYLTPGIQKTIGGVVSESDIVNQLYTQRRIKKQVMPFGTFQIPYDTVRLHILTGYIFGDCLGFMLSVKARQESKAVNLSTENEIVLQNFTFHKGNIVQSVKFNPHPMYMSSKFYDRYIEFKIPSAYYLANSGGALASAVGFEVGSDTIFEYTKIEDDLFNASSSMDMHEYVSSTDENLHLYNQGTFGLSEVVTATVVLNSNSDNFNAKIYEDEKYNCIRYYSIWGAVTSDAPVTVRIMNSIENGSIPMVAKGFLDENEGDIDTFEQIYGEGARKWIIVNQLELNYVYKPLIQMNAQSDNDLERSQMFSMTENFENDDDRIMNVDDLYKFYYRPVINSISGYYCDYIDITYTARLINRLNGEEVVRVATMQVNDAEAKYGLKSVRISVDNLYSWKLFNKIETTQPMINAATTGRSTTKYVTKFFDASDVVIQDSEGNPHTQGTYTLKIFETDHTYKFRLFTDEAMKTAMQLSETNATYLMRFADKDGEYVYLKPTYSLNMSETRGELEYKLTADLAGKALSGDKKFAVIAQTENGISTLIAGKFESIYEES